MTINSNLRHELTGILLEAWSDVKSEIIFTGETFSTNTLAVARAYERATSHQQAAVRAVIELWETLP